MFELLLGSSVNYLYWDQEGSDIINRLRLRQRGHHFTDDIFKCIFLNEDILIVIEISVKFVPKGPINNIPTLDQTMALCEQGNKPLSEPMIA